jgi:hypothetical protein
MKKILGVICFLTFMINAGLSSQDDALKQYYVEDGAKSIQFRERHALLFDVPGDGSCFFYAAGISRSAFKQRLQEVKGKDIKQLFPHAGNRLALLEKAIRGADLSSAIYNDQKANIDSDQTDDEGNSPLDQMSPAELFSFLFDSHITVYKQEENGELKQFSTYNPSGKTKINLLWDSSNHYQLIVFDDQTDVEEERQRGTRCLKERNKLPESRSFDRLFREPVNALPVEGNAAYPNSDSDSEPALKRSRSEDFQDSSPKSASSSALRERTVNNDQDDIYLSLTGIKDNMEYRTAVKEAIKTLNIKDVDAYLDACKKKIKDYYVDIYPSAIDIRTEIEKENIPPEKKKDMLDAFENFSTGIYTGTAKEFVNRSQTAAASSSPAAQYTDMRGIFDGTPLETVSKKPNVGVSSISSLKGLLKYIEDNKSSINASDTSIVFDIDHTLVDGANGGRDMSQSKLIEDDLPEILQSLKYKGFKIFFVTGREPKYSQPTIAFFNQKDIDCNVNNLACVGEGGDKGGAIRRLCPTGSIFFIDDQPAYLADVLAHLQTRNLRLFGYNVQQEDISIINFYIEERLKHLL